MVREPGTELDALAHSVIGAAIEVHRALGLGYLESVYEKALCIELAERGINFVNQYPVYAEYKGHRVGEGRVDLLVDDKLVLELKTAERITNVHEAQTISYLKATENMLGLILNFNVAVMKDGVRRVIYSK